MTTHNDELKPCPFCGSEVKLISGFEPIGGHFVDCEGCGMSGKLTEEKQTAIDAWNKRNPSNEPQPAAGKVLTDVELYSAFMKDRNGSDKDVGIIRGIRAVLALSSRSMQVVPEWIKSKDRLPEPSSMIVKRWRNGAVWAGKYSGKEKDSSFDEWIYLPVPTLESNTEEK